MPSGLQIYDENGNITLDITDNVAKYLGSFNTGVSPGSFVRTGSLVNDGLTTGQLWWLSTLAPQSEVNSLLTLTRSGNVLNWSAGPQCPDVVVYFGVF